MSTNNRKAAMIKAADPSKQPKGAVRNTQRRSSTLSPEDLAGVAGGVGFAIRPGAISVGRSGFSNPMRAGAMGGLVRSGVNEVNARVAQGVGKLVGNLAGGGAQYRPRNPNGAAAFNNQRVGRIGTVVVPGRPRNPSGAAAFNQRPGSGAVSARPRNPLGAAAFNAGARSGGGGGGRSQAVARPAKKGR